MMLSLLPFAVATAATAAPTTNLQAPTPPVYPPAWVGVEDLSVQTVGPIQRSSSISYFDLANNRSAQTNITHSQYDTIVTNFDGDGGQGQEYYIRTYEQKGVVARHCQFWCNPSGGGIPCNTGDSLCSFDYQKRAKFVGTKTLNGETTNEFTWGENLGPIPMNKLTLYTKTSAPFAPVRMFRALHPFGKDIGNTTIDYVSWTPQTTPFDEAVFDLGPDAKYGCASPQPGDDCQQAQAQMRARRGEQ